MIDSWRKTFLVACPTSEYNPIEVSTGPVSALSSVGVLVFRIGSGVPRMTKQEDEPYGAPFRGRDLSSACQAPPGRGCCPVPRCGRKPVRASRVGTFRAGQVPAERSGA